MPTVTSLQKNKALANAKLMSNGMIEISPDANATALPLDIVMVLDVSDFDERDWRPSCH